MAVYTRIQISDVKKILAPYQIEALDFTPIEGGNTNSNYHVRAKKGEYILTIAEEKSLEEVRDLASLLQCLGEHHFPTSRLLTSAGKEPVTIYSGQPILVKEWIPGSVHENLSGNQLRQIGQTMAQLHQIPAPDYLPKLHPYEQQAFSGIMDKSINPEYENWLKKKLQFFEQKRPKNLPIGLIHGDVFFDNVLFEPNDIKAIIDFEEACDYYLIFDIAMGILGLCRVDEKIDLKKANALVRGYEEVRPLTFLEKDSLVFFIEYAAVATSCWRFWKYNIHSPSPHLSDRYEEMVRVAKEVAKFSKAYFSSIVFK